MSGLTEFSKTEAGLATLREAYAGKTFEVATKTGMAEATAARREIKATRVAVEKLREELKAPLLEQGRLIDGEAKRITAELVALEDPIDKQIKAEETRAAREAAEKAAAEAQREREVNAALAQINMIPMKAVGEDSASLYDRATTLVAADYAQWGDALSRFEDARNAALADLRRMYAAARKAEADAAELAQLRAAAARAAPPPAEPAPTPPAPAACAPDPLRAAIAALAVEAPSLEQVLQATGVSPLLSAPTQADTPTILQVGNAIHEEAAAVAAELDEADRIAGMTLRQASSLAAAWFKDNGHADLFVARALRAVLDRPL